MTAAYLFLSKFQNCILAYETCFSNTLCSVAFIAQISHYGKFMALHILISIVLQLTNQIK